MIDETERRPGLPLNPGFAADELVEQWWMYRTKKKAFMDFRKHEDLLSGSLLWSRRALIRLTIGCIVFRRMDSSEVKISLGH